MESVAGRGAGGGSTIVGGGDGSGEEGAVGTADDSCGWPPGASIGRSATAKKQTMNTLSSMLGKTWRFMVHVSGGRGAGG